MNRRQPLNSPTFAAPRDRLPAEDAAAVLADRIAAHADPGLAAAIARMAAALQAESPAWSPLECQRRAAWPCCGGCVPDVGIRHGRHIRR